MNEKELVYYSHAKAELNNGNALNGYLYLDSLFRVKQLSHPEILILYHYLKSHFLFYHLSHPDSALANLESMKKYAADGNEYSTLLIAEASLLTAESFIKSDPEKAYHLYFLSMKIADSLGGKCAAAPSKRGLATLFLNRGEYRKAAYLYKESVKAAEYCIFKDFATRSMSQSMALNNVGLSYEYLEDFDSALMYYDKALNHCEYLRDSFPEHLQLINITKGVIWGNVGSTYLRMGDLIQAETFLNRSIKINHPDSMEPRDTRLNQIKLARLWMQRGNWPQADSLLQLANPIKTDPQNKGALSRWYDAKRDFCLGSKNFEEAWFWQKKLDSLKHVTISPIQASLPTDFEQTFQIIEQKDKVSELQFSIRQNRITLVLLVCILSLTIALVVFLRKRQQNSNKHLKEVKVFNRKLKESNQRLENSLEALKASQDQNAKMMKVLAHDLKSPISSMMSMTNLMLEMPLSDEERTSMSILMVDSCKHALGFIDNLLHQNITGTDLRRRNTDFQSLLSSSVNTMSTLAAEKELSIKLKSFPVELYVDEEKIWRVLNNLLSNSIKFSHRSSEILVNMQAFANEIHVKIIDFGIGIPESMMNQLFVFNPDIRRKGTEHEQSNGIGLGISMQIMQAHGGNLMVISEEGRGSTFTLVFPRVHLGQ